MNSNLDLEQELNSLVEENIECRTDHLGNVFDTISAMCRNYGVSYATYKARLRAGHTKEEALNPKLYSKGKAVELDDRTDHLGNIFDSVTAMCEHYGVALSTYMRRRGRSGWSKEDALTRGIHRGAALNKFIEIDGKEYTKKDIRETFGVTESTFKKRTEKGESLEEILERPTCYKTKGPNGKWYKNESEMCADYGVKHVTYRHRLLLGYTEEEALTSENLRSKKVTDFKGIEYPSERQMCKAYKVSTGTYRSRLNKGLTQEEALTK